MLCLSRMAIDREERGGEGMSYIFDWYRNGSKRCEWQVTTRGG